MGITIRVKRQVTTDVSTGIILTNFLTRRGEKGQQYLVCRMLFTNTFHQRKPLFEFSKGSCVKPNILGFGVYLLLKNTECIVFAIPHFLNLLAKMGYNPHAKGIKIHQDIVHELIFFSESLKPYDYAGPKTCMAFFKRRIVSSLPKKAEISNIPGPLPIPTRARRKVFITSPIL